MIRRPRVAVLLALTGALVAFFAFDLKSLLTLEALERSRSAFRELYAERPASCVAAYVGLYAVLTGASIPGATLLTLAGGAAFGLLVGVLATSVASTAGATLSFLSSRYLLRDLVRSRFAPLLARVDRGVEREGAFYLFALRLAPIFPFFVVNLLSGITNVRVSTYVWVSLVGMLPGTLVYVNAGAEVGDLTQAGDLLSPRLIVAFALLGVLPLASRRLLGLLRRRRALAGHAKPRRFDWDVVVVGAGSAGLVAANVARFLRARVALVERDRMGGDCLNTGCVPSKALIRASRALAEVRRARRFGLEAHVTRVDFARVMSTVREAVEGVAPHDSPERYRGLGVEVIHGNARLTSPYHVRVTTGAGVVELSTRNVIVATGAHPRRFEVPGVSEVPVYTSDDVWSLDELPRRLLVIGGGPIGCELGQAFARLGSQVTLVEAAPGLLPSEEVEAGSAVASALTAEGVQLWVGTRVERFTREDGQPRAVLRGSERPTGDASVPFDACLVAVGRRPNALGFGLEDLGAEIDPEGRIETDAFLATNLPTVYACGDVAGRVHLTHAAGHAGWYAAVNALMRPFARFRFDDAVMPRCTFTEPEVARVGLTSSEAKSRGVDVETTLYDLADLDRAIVDRADTGFVRVLTAANAKTIVGVTIVASHASEMLAEWSLAMQHGLGVDKVLRTVHPYPTFSEANKAAAAAWARQRAPERALRWLERLHRFRRG